MKILFTYVLCISIFILHTQAIFTNIEKGEEFCAYRTLTEGNNFTGSYVISGYNEDAISMKLFSPNGTQIMESLSKREGKFNFITTENGIYKVCYKSLDNKPKVLSFDFTSIQKNEKLAATSENVDQVSTQIKKAYRTLQSVFRNQQYQHTREDTHRKNIESLENKVRWSAFIKILILLVITVGQIYVMTGFFKNRKNLPVQFNKTKNIQKRNQTLEREVEQNKILLKVNKIY